MSLRQFFFYAFLLGGVAVLAWLAIPTPSVARAAPLVEEPWKLPTLPSYDSRNALATLTAGGLWGKLAETASPPAGEAEWRFVGVVGRGEVRYVIIKQGDQSEQTLAPGDSLPGGSKILSIENDRLCLLINGNKRSLDIYPQGRLSGKMSALPNELAVTQTAGSNRR